MCCNYCASKNNYDTRNWPLLCAIVLLADRAAVTVHYTDSLYLNSGFHCGVNEICALSGFYAAWNDLFY
jgi:hypothetical protein